MLNLNQIATELKVFFDTEFPDSSVHVRVGSNLMDSVSVHFTMEPKSKWPNGIFHNANYAILMIFNVKPDAGPKAISQRETESGVYRVELTSRGGNAPRLSSRTAPAVKLISYVKAYFEKWGSGSQD